MFGVYWTFMDTLTLMSMKQKVQLFILPEKDGTMSNIDQLSFVQKIWMSSYVTT